MSAPLKKRNQQGHLELSATNASASATASEKVFKAPSTRRVRVTSVEYNNPTGLAADASNYFTIQLKNGANVIATWSTQTGANGALTADTPVSMVLTPANQVLAGGDVLSVVLTKSGTQTLPAGRFFIHATILD